MQPRKQRKRASHRFKIIFIVESNKIVFAQTFGRPKKDWLKISEGKRGWRLYEGDTH